MSQTEADGGREVTGLPPADARRRLSARLLDLVIALSPLLLVPRGHAISGVLLAGGLLLCGDALSGEGRSVGKRLFGLRVVLVRTRRPGGVRDSMGRNSTLVVGLLPAAFGAALPVTLLTLGVVVLAEACIALRPLTRDPAQRRFGDLVAGTQVVDGRVALPLGAPGLVAKRTAPAPLASRAAKDPLSRSAPVESACPGAGRAQPDTPPPPGAACASP